MTVGAALVYRVAAGPIPGGDTDLAKLRLENGRSYVVFANGAVSGRHDLDVTLQLQTFFEGGMNGEVRVAASRQAPEGLSVEHEVVRLSFTLTIAVNVPSDEDGFFTVQLSGRSSMVTGFVAFLESGSIVALEVDGFSIS
jgi:hypothetical protein